MTIAPALRAPGFQLSCLAHRTCDPKGRQIMIRYQTKSDELPKSYDRRANAALCLAAASLAAGLTFGTDVQTARAAPPQATPFKVTNVHLETNSSACDMGAQIKFDT